MISTENPTEDVADLAQRRIGFDTFQDRGHQADRLVARGVGQAVEGLLYG